jgi:hypothetical protein
MIDVLRVKDAHPATRDGRFLLPGNGEPLTHKGLLAAHHCRANMVKCSSAAGTTTKMEG